MNRNRMMMLGIAALALSVLVTFFLYRMVQRRVQPREQTTHLIVAAEKLTLGMRITEGSVRLASWPAGLTFDGGFTDLKDVIGRGVITTMLANEPVLETKLAPREAGAGLTSVIPDGMRALAVKVDDVVGVAGFVLPGTRVDVIMTGAARPNEDIASRIILENVQVLAAGQNVQQDVNGKPQNVQVVTLLVSPEQSQDLALAAANEHIQLALRNPLDTEHRDPIAVRRAALFSGGANMPPGPQEKPAARPNAPKITRAAPAAAPPAPPRERVWAVELFLGRTKETITFPEKIK